MRMGGFASEETTLSGAWRGEMEGPCLRHASCVPGPHLSFALL